MNIVDLRKEKYTSWNGAELLQKIIDTYGKENFHGINKIILLDKDYSSKNSAGRWIKKDGGVFEIEIMFDTLDIYPSSMLEKEITIVFELSRILLHELYHHKHFLNGKKNRRKSKDEEIADYWGFKEALEVIKKLYSNSQISSFKKQFYEIMGWE